MSEVYPPRKTLCHYCGLPLTGSPNSGHTATGLRPSAQIRQSRTSYVRKTMNRNDASLSAFVGTFRFTGGRMCDASA